MTGLETLRQLKPGDILSSADVFDAIFEAGSVLSDNDREADSALEIAIRLLEASRNEQIPNGCEQVVEMLAEECGLYPYVDPNNFSHLTQTVIEAHAVQLHEKLYLHAKQMQILLWLLGGDNVILSAPTSFGKTLLIDAFISYRRPHTVVIILPTIALIDECRRRLLRTFSDTYELLTTVSDRYDSLKNTIFVLTQERFIQRDDKLKIDFLVVDEFYKLDPSRGDNRFDTLNLALYRALPRARQCFMAGPHIREIELGKRWTGHFRFVRTDYRTVTVNVVDRSDNELRFETFLADLASVGDQNSLVFTATPNTAQKLMDNIIAAGVSYESPLGADLGQWIAENYHREWPIAHGSAKGIAIHHGRLPRSLGQLFVHLFDHGTIKVLICTSTLIEGVNTSAANVFIYDKRINRTDFDFFSFANIRGRVGRMMRHFVGNAFLYHEPPAEIETKVEVPVLANPSGSTDFLVMNVARRELSVQGRKRRDELPVTTGLSPEILREHGRLGIEILMELHRRIKAKLSEDPNKLIWTGFPNRDQRKTVAELALWVAHQRQDPTGLHTPAQIGWAWSQLRTIRTLPKFLRWFAATFFSEKKAEGVDAAFQFLQACEFAFPRSLSAIEAIVVYTQPDSGINYRPYVAALENWFRPAWMKELDEAGVPLPLAERLAPLLQQPKDRSEAIAKIRELIRSYRFSHFNDVDWFILEIAVGR